jgi:hypothetical protein
MLTGSNKDGTLAEGDATCGGWNSTVGFAVLGHSDKVGAIGPDSNSWNSAHLSERQGHRRRRKLGSENAISRALHHRWNCYILTPQV